MNENKTKKGTGGWKCRKWGKVGCVDRFVAFGKIDRYAQFSSFLMSAADFTQWLVQWFATIATKQFSWYFYKLCNLRSISKLLNQALIQELPGHSLGDDLLVQIVIYEHRIISPELY